MGAFSFIAALLINGHSINYKMWMCVHLWGEKMLFYVDSRTQNKVERKNKFRGIGYF